MNYEKSLKENDKDDNENLKIDNKDKIDDRIDDKK